MSSLTERYVENPAGRTFVISMSLALVSIGLLFYLAVQNPVETKLGFLYKPLPLEKSNWALVAVILVLLQITFLALVIGLANREDLFNRVPSWTQIFLPMFITELLAFFIVNVTVTGAISGSEADVGLSNFNKEMSLAIGWGNLALMILWAFYFYYLSKED